MNTYQIIVKIVLSCFLILQWHLSDAQLADQQISQTNASITLAGLITSYPTSCIGTVNFGLEVVSVHIYNENPFGSGAPTPVRTVLTDYEGVFEATSLAPGFDYWVVPVKQHNPNCGLSVVDLAILRDLMPWSKIPAKDNWTLFVANVSHFDTSLSIRDIIGLRCRLINCLPHPTNSFPLSWFFMKSTDWLNWIHFKNWSPEPGIHVPPAQQFYELKNVTSDISFLDFRAGKAGDIVPNCTTCNNINPDDDAVASMRQSQPARVVQGAVITGDNHTVASIPYYLPDVKGDQIWLISLGFPMDTYEIESVEPLGIFQSEHFLWNVEEGLGSLSILWSPVEMNPLPSSENLPAFVVKVRSLDGQPVDASSFSLKAHPSKDGLVENLYTIRPWELVRDESAHFTRISEKLIVNSPTSSEVNVRLPYSPPGGQMAIYDVSGREVYRHTWPGEQHRFSVSGWPAGLYFINYYGSDGQYASGRVVVE